MIRFGAFMARLELAHQRQREQEAAGWVVVCQDDENDSLVNATGLFETAEQAFVHAGERAREDERWREPGEAGWTYSVLPMFAP